MFESEREMCSQRESKVCRQLRCPDDSILPHYQKAGTKVEGNSVAMLAVFREDVLAPVR